MTGRTTLAIFCAGLMCLTGASWRTLGEQPYRSDSAPKSAAGGQSSRLSDSSLQRNGNLITLDSENPERVLDVERSKLSGESSLTGNGETQWHGIAKPNKASSLIGMEVRNQQNEKLGDIKDVVMDLPSGRISYAVLSTGGFLGLGNRLIAIPPSAFQMSADSDHLLINADRQKIMSSPSFARTNWPDPKSANFEAYWASEREAVGGAAADVSVGAGLGRSSSNDRQQDRTSDRTESRYSSDRSSKENRVFKGKITAIKPEARTMRVEGEDGPRDFTFTARPTLTLKENRNPHIIDFKVGYPVSVGYHEEGKGNYVAHSVTRTDAPEVK